MVGGRDAAAKLLIEMQTIAINKAGVMDIQGFLRFVNKYDIYGMDRCRIRRKRMELQLISINASALS